MTRDTTWAQAMEIAVISFSVFFQLSRMRPMSGASQFRVVAPPSPLPSSVRLSRMSLIYSSMQSIRRVLLFVLDIFFRFVDILPCIAHPHPRPVPRPPVCVTDCHKVFRCVQAEGRCACGGLRSRRRGRPREAAYGSVHRISVVARALPVGL